MINIQPIKAFNDNYIWAIVNNDNQQAIVIDPGQAQPVIDFINANNLYLTAIWITHKHADHTGGIVELRDPYPWVQVVADSQHGVRADYIVKEGSHLQAWGYDALVWKTAGHTENHLAYLLDIDKKRHVFCGDTLFSAGCGRVFTGDMQAMFASLQRLNTLAEDTLFYPAHEYTASNLQFALYIEPDNQAMQKWLAEVESLLANGKASLPNSLQIERLINPFLRVTKASVINSLKQKVELADDKPLTVFTALRRLKDAF